ncbi:2Fe-2S iron-sulfur cluster binding domain-containing protein [Marinomonas mediterranea]|jgi:Ferredoxin|uniref:Ferredoxin n=1 Tax=Marinomonas mediterranea (strain ATCC 700492 / JCM 21426 / NBRC 103028 / MMB-1) TaxID=717774 RepID=F2JZA2_MARM1|nr:2Fe-2S iron-sulfur cluster-binding protein [Marinomonas mediterranea]ADZ93187.1 ferredoxin [Marinomonas mediterranea MMB-1]WCN15145.1 2Fe-2S iron-sulfur cluster binding domain-containing protein [Marinomonas mediterranea]WCN19188.1 2Fe-2S iron-sulfur cluster binding domain-containing protein [Marinomonas mediterranea MMB-1]
MTLEADSITIRLVDNSSEDRDSTTILVHDGETLLEAMLRRGIEIKHACRNAACGICLTPLLEGEIDYQGRIPRGLSKQEEEDGYILPCIATCKHAITLDSHRWSS